EMDSEATYWQMVNGVRFQGEVFRPVDGNENYLVSNFGRVWSKNREMFIVPDGKYIGLSKRGIPRKGDVDDLVRKAFGREDGTIENWFMPACYFVLWVSASVPKNNAPSA